VTGIDPAATALRDGPVAAAIRRERLIVVLRRVAPRERLLALVDELVDAGARIFEVTLDAPEAAADLVAVREQVRDAADRCLVGAGTVLTERQLQAARDAGAAFAVAPVLDAELVAVARDAGLPFIPGALSPTEIAAAWAAGATMVKLFPASAVGPALVRELRGPLPEIALIPTGGVDGENARAYLAAGATAVGIGGAIARAGPAERRRIVAAVRA
jgi:2-dehydro-3-deoxyphosphogluconate aldolase/(4S)-4-hydroxy-2-oxoglutarate aldolase